MLSPALVLSLAVLPTPTVGAPATPVPVDEAEVTATLDDAWELPTRLPPNLAASDVPVDVPPSLLRDEASAGSGTGAVRPRAFEYSDGYRVRLKIHRAASFTMLPLFATQYALGRKLYSGNFSDNTRRWHRRVAFGIGTLFTANTVTGVWNLVEGRKNPDHRHRRVLHGLLMLAADAGFATAGINAPRIRHGELTGFKQSTHRALAISSVGLATTGYLIMLIGH